MIFPDDFVKTFTVNNKEVVIEVFDISVSKGLDYSDNPWDLEDEILYQYNVLESTEDLTKDDIRNLQDIISNTIRMEN